MISKFVRSLLLQIVTVAALVATASAHHHDKGGTDIDFALAFDDDVVVPESVAGDSTAVEQFREEMGQDFSSLFDGTESGENDLMGIDTVFAWSNSTINSGRFDYKTLGPEDTIRIALVDTAQGRFYFYPHDGGYVTSRFGPRRFLWHYGTDTKLNIGDTVRTSFDGVVRVIQFDRRGYGNVVVVRHHNGIETLYGHLHRVSVEPNQLVRAGETIGLGGNTGRSTGAHLHFEIRYFGEPFSPEYIIDFQNHTLKSDTLVLTRGNFEYLTELRRQVVHTVRRGDNLGSIARRYGTTVNNICRLNGITPKTTLRVGRRLVVRSGKEAEKQVISTAVVAPAAAVQETSPETQPPEILSPEEESMPEETSLEIHTDTVPDTSSVVRKSTVASVSLEPAQTVD